MSMKSSGIQGCRFPVQESSRCSSTRSPTASFSRRNSSDGICRTTSLFSGSTNLTTIWLSSVTSRTGFGGLLELLVSGAFRVKTEAFNPRAEMDTVSSLAFCGFPVTRGADGAFWAAVAGRAALACAGGVLGVSFGPTGWLSSVAMVHHLTIQNWVRPGSCCTGITVLGGPGRTLQ
ncbi:protein of unknown function [Nitrospina watsonii]|uniref:Uncharacterized protein n=1 Tax=Nitrospina watsonii TaxID=1323948 RepID=A0ABM9HHN0_9BACT|nr:protein of unknown function [Nitrospina watsonii]